MPSFIGKNELVTNTTDFFNATNKVVLSSVLSIKPDMYRSGTIAYLDDVARLHIDALKPEIASNQDFPASSGSSEGIALGNALDIAAKHFHMGVGRRVSEQRLDSHAAYGD